MMLQEVNVLLKTGSVNCKCLSLSGWHGLAQQAGNKQHFGSEEPDLISHESLCRGSWRSSTSDQLSTCLLVFYSRLAELCVCFDLFWGAGVGFYSVTLF